MHILGYASNQLHNLTIRLQARGFCEVMVDDGERQILVETQREFQKRDPEYMLFKKNPP